MHLSSDEAKAKLLRRLLWWLFDCSSSNFWQTPVVGESYNLVGPPKMTDQVGAIG